MLHRLSFYCEAHFWPPANDNTSKNQNTCQHLIYETNMSITYLNVRLNYLSASKFPSQSNLLCDTQHFSRSVRQCMAFVMFACTFFSARCKFHIKIAKKFSKLIFKKYCQPNRVQVHCIFVESFADTHVQFPGQNSHCFTLPASTTLQIMTTKILMKPSRLCFFVLYGLSLFF